MTKRIFDILFSVFALIILLPVFLIISLIIKLSMAGPVLFVQPRIGINGKRFLLYKFRSMRVSDSSNIEIFEPGKLDRITKFGKILRRTKMDELPQLYNVLKGDMSLVGPRPEVKKWVDLYPERWANVLKVKPGITDIASVLYKSEEHILSNSEDPETIYREIILPKKLQIYEEYVTEHTFLGDLKIIILTVFKIFKSN